MFRRLIFTCAITAAIISAAAGYASSNEGPDPLPATAAGTGITLALGLAATVIVKNAVDDY